MSVSRPEKSGGNRRTENMNTETDKIDKHFTLCEAAPDLLEALERLVSRVERDQRADNSEYGPSGRDLLNDCKAAIAKAKKRD